MYKYLIALALFILPSCNIERNPISSNQLEKLETDPFVNGRHATIHFLSGRSFNHPLIVFWIEDTLGNYLETLYASKSISTGIFRYGVNENGKWTSGERRRPAALPYWSHKHGVVYSDSLFIPTSDKPLPDAVTGATPGGSFMLGTTIPRNLKRFILLMEINQPWDWNNYWNNNRFPENVEYATSAQPALVYAVNVNMDSLSTKFYLKPVGHSHYAGLNGELYPDISTFSTALDITSEVWIKVE